MEGLGCRDARLKFRASGRGFRVQGAGVTNKISHQTRHRPFPTP